MKKNLLIVLLFIGSISMNAQFTVETHAGNPIVDGQIITVGELGEASTVPFYVFNNTGAEINMKIKFVSAVNADGIDMEVCFGDCYSHIVIGESYPFGYSIQIPANSHQGTDGDHFLNRHVGNGTDIQDYVFRFHQVDGVGNEIGTPLTMTYRYDPLLAASDFNKLDVSVYPTVTEGKLTVDTDETLELSIYDLQGRLVSTSEMTVGKNEIDMSNVASQMYLLHFKNEQGQSQITKIIVN